VFLILTIFFVVFKVVRSKRVGEKLTGLREEKVSKLDEWVIRVIGLGGNLYLKIYSGTKMVVTKHIPRILFDFLSKVKNKTKNNYYEILSIRGGRVVSANKRNSEFLKKMEIVRMNGNNHGIENNTKV